MRGFVPFLLIALIIAIVLRVDFLFTIVYLLALIYVFSRLWVDRIHGTLGVEQHFTDHVFLGDSLQIDVALHNRNWLPVAWLEMHESLAVELTAPLPSELLRLRPHEDFSYRYDVACRKRGYYAVGPLNLRFGDVLGIIPPQNIILKREFVTVYPRIVPLNELGLPTRSPLAVLRTPMALFEDPSQIMGVREYQPGDSPRQIHWTASASAGQLLVKRYQPAVARETMVFLDMNREHYPREHSFDAVELAIIVAASVANHIMLREKLPVGLAVEGRDPLSQSTQNFVIPARAEKAHLMHVLEILARVEPAETSFIDLIRREQARLKWGATVALITGQETQALYDVLLLLQRTGFAVALIVVQPGRARQAPAGLIPPRGLSVYRITELNDLKVAL